MRALAIRRAADLRHRTGIGALDATNLPVTVGFAQLGFGKAVLATALWPYYLGKLLAASGAS